MMRRRNAVVLFAVTAATITAFAGSASAEIGKQVSVATGNSGVIPAYPTMVDALTVGVPATYKSKARFLKVTVSYLASCSGGDFMGSLVHVGGVPLADQGIPFETLDEDAVGQVVSKVYYLVPENQGGPVVPPDSMVTLKLTSQLGAGCTATNGTMTVKAAK
ncbi:MAG: hypothetical protein ABR538_01105 [Candidatus Binatia bacterium]